MNGPNTSIIDPVLGTPRLFTFDHSFWSHDGFKADESGVSVPDDIDSLYAD